MAIRLSILAFAFLCTCFAEEPTIEPPPLVVEQPAASSPVWERVWGYLFSHPVAQPEVAKSTCRVSALLKVTDPAALAFEEAGDAAAVIDRSGLTSATASALERFEAAILRMGGTLRITSAYRPSSYQQHLQDVWDKWMQLRHNREAGCQELKAEVGQEFMRHQLLDRQRPVDVSDHTLGTAFDAAVLLPLRNRRRRVPGLDQLARLCNLKRPDRIHDPVHFRLT